MQHRKDPPQLLFTRHQRQGIDHEDYICLWPGRKNAPCEFLAPDFSQLIIHFFRQHGLKLHQGVDYCRMCQTIFSSTIGGTEHYLRHAIDMGSLHEGPLYESGSGNNEELEETYEKLKDLRKQILKKIFRKWDEGENEVDFEGEDVPDSQGFSKH